MCMCLLYAGTNINKVYYEVLALAYDYELFKSQIFRLTAIDLSSYKERQMKRRIDALISKNGFKGYEESVKAIEKDKALYDSFVAY